MGKAARRKHRQGAQGRECRALTEVTKPRPYNGTAIQRALILSRLEKGPATGAQLQTECNAPDPTARIHELRTEGHAIDTHWTDQTNPDGSVNRVALYVLRVRDERQLELIPSP